MTIDTNKINFSDSNITFITIDDKTDLNDIYTNLLSNALGNQQPFSLPNKVEKPHAFTLSRIDKTVEFDELPNTYQNFLVGSISEELTIYAAVFNKLLSLVSDIHQLCPDSNKKLFADIFQVTPIIYHFFTQLTKNSECYSEASDDIFELQNVIERCLGYLRECEQQFSNKSKELCSQVISIFNELEESLNGTGLALNKYDTLLFNIIPNDDSERLSTNLDDIQLKAREVSRIYRTMNTLCFTNQNEYIFNDDPVLDCWGSTKKTFDTYITNIKKRKKKPLNIANLTQLHQYTYSKLTPYNAFSITAKNKMCRSIYMNKERDIDFDGYGLSSIIKKKFSHVNTLSNSAILRCFNQYALAGILPIVKINALEIRHEIIKAIDTKANEEDLIINKEAAEEFLSMLQEMSNQLSTSKVGCENNIPTCISTDGRETYSSTFQRIESVITTFSIRLDQYKKGSKDTSIGNFYMRMFWIDYYLRGAINTFVDYSLSSIRQEITEISQLRKKCGSKASKKRLQLVMQEKKLEKDLTNLTQFTKTYERFCEPVLHQIENFAESFLQKNEDPQVDNNANAKVEEIQNEEKVQLQIDAIQKKAPAKKASKKKINNDTNINIIGFGESFLQKNEAPQVNNNANAKGEEIQFEEKAQIQIEGTHKKAPAKKAPKKKINNDANINIIGALDKIEDSISADKKKIEKGEYFSVHNVKWKSLVEEVVEAGYKFLRQKGGHLQYAKDGKGVVTIPRHGKRDTVSTGVVKAVRKEINR